MSRISAHEPLSPSRELETLFDGGCLHMEDSSLQLQVAQKNYIQCSRINPPPAWTRRSPRHSYNHILFNPTLAPFPAAGLGVLGAPNTLPPRARLSGDGVP